MDPDACLARLLDAITAGDRATATEAARDLARWLEHGGFLPAYPF